MKLANPKSELPNKKKFISDMSIEEKGEIDHGFPFPKRVYDEIKSYPESSFHEDKRWKIVDYSEKEDGSANLVFIRDDEKVGTPEMSYSGVMWFSDEETFKAEKKQYEAGVLKEIDDRTMEKHIENNTFQEKDLEKINVRSRFGTVNHKLKEHVRINNGKSFLI